MFFKPLPNVDPNSDSLDDLFAWGTAVGRRITMRRRLRRTAFGLLLAVLFAFVAVFFAPVVARAAPGAWDIEIGQEFTLTSAPSPYLLARYNWRLADIRVIDSQVWLLPEAGIFLSPLSGYGRLQLLLDTPAFTLGAEGRAGDDTRARIFLRFNL